MRDVFHGDHVGCQADCSRGSLEDFARERAIGFGAARLGVVER